MTKVAKFDSPTILALRMAIERTSGFTPETPLHFERIAQMISQKTNEKISPTTLKRLWGYMTYPHQPRRIILDILSRYTGAADWTDFQQSTKPEGMVSGKINAFTLRVADLSEGQRIELSWLPDRIVTLQYLGNDEFEVINSKNSKLTEGERFRSSGFTTGSQAILYGLHHTDSPHDLTDYVAGYKGGVVWHLLD